MTKTRPSPRWSWSQAGALLAFLGCAWFHGAVAKADCAHGIILQNVALDRFTTLEDLVFGRALGDLAGKMPTGADSPGSPCRSGLCSRPPFVPPAPATDPIQSEDWGLLESRLAPSRPASEGSFADDPTLQAIIRPSSVYHPPRIAS
ncbi:MAG TPA: hypothetical protein VGZ22_27895 [Isosphaeraceae bacterium]|nr:hypothetical protein [Isosphaeraceae bacterium]